MASSSASGCPTASIAASTPARLPSLLGGGAGILLGEVHGGRAEALGHPQALRDRVDGDHRSGTGRQRRLGRAEADRPEAKDGDALARLDAGLGDGVVAGPHDVAGEQGDVVRHPLGDATQGQVGPGDEQLLGLGSLERAEG